MYLQNMTGFLSRDAYRYYWNNKYKMHWLFKCISYRFHHLGNFIWQAVGGRPFLTWHLHCRIFSPRDKIGLIIPEFLKVVQNFALPADLGTQVDGWTNEVAPLLLILLHILLFLSFMLFNNYYVMVLDKGCFIFLLFYWIVVHPPGFLSVRWAVI